ncbi:transcription factor GTE11-like [Actinidia eriantha]|uniref:transcription factor GTE11-like n=1 Tax=Actinidia eriantha TaxID=165200 RepID=UPI00258DEB4F|nr:transcription factor GTE11-like [Actinidia eriantha]
MKGSARALAQEHICSLNEPASGEDCSPLVDVQLSPKMALRAAMLRSRFAKIILKANTILDHGDKADLVLLQKQKESLKRQQLEGHLVPKYTDLEVVRRPIGDIHVGNVLQRLGLFLKDDYTEG